MITSYSHMIAFTETFMAFFLPVWYRFPWCQFAVRYCDTL